MVKQIPSCWTIVKLALAISRNGPSKIGDGHINVGGTKPIMPTKSGQQKQQKERKTNKQNVFKLFCSILSDGFYVMDNTQVEELRSYIVHGRDMTEEEGNRISKKYFKRRVRQHVPRPDLRQLISYFSSFFSLLIPDHVSKLMVQKPFINVANRRNNQEQRMNVVHYV